MHGARWLVLLSLTACGSSVAVDEGDSGSDTEPGSTTAHDDTSSDSSGVTTADPSGPAASSSSGDPSSEGDGADGSSSGGVAQGWCLRGEPVVLPGRYDSRSLRPDSDDNGRDEWWIQEPHWDPVTREGSTTLEIYEHQRGAFELRATTLLSGSVLHVGDVDGDGRPDAILRAWDDPQVWWQRGLDDFEFESTAQPFEAVSPSAHYADVDGDGSLDAVGDPEGFGSLELFLGDGAGGFESAGELDVGGRRIEAVFPGSRAQEKLLHFEQEVLGFGSDTSLLWLTNVVPGGTVDVVASIGDLDFAPVVLAEVDGDGVADVLGRDERMNVMTWLRSSGTQYEEVVLARGIRGLVAGPWTEPGAADALAWGESVRLYQPSGDGWVGTDVQTDPGFEVSGNHVPLHADDDGLHELLQIGQTHSLWRVEPCD